MDLVYKTIGEYIMAKKYTIQLTKGDNAYATIKLVADGINIFTANNVPINKDIMYDIWKKGINVEIENRDEYNQKLESNRKNKAQEKRIREMKSDAYEYLTDYLIKNNYIKQSIKIKKLSDNSYYDYLVRFDSNIHTVVEAYSYEYITQSKCKSCINLNPRRKKDNFYLTTSILDDIAQDINKILESDLYQPNYTYAEYFVKEEFEKFKRTKGEMYIIQMV